MANVVETQVRAKVALARADDLDNILIKKGEIGSVLIWSDDVVKIRFRRFTGWCNPDYLEEVKLR